MTEGDAPVNKFHAGAVAMPSGGVEGEDGGSIEEICGNHAAELLEKSPKREVQPVGERLSQIPLWNRAKLVDVGMEADELLMRYPLRKVRDKPPDLSTQGTPRPVKVQRLRFQQRHAFLCLPVSLL